ncbi:MAG: antibiotic biosynthesis monooxygenase [Thermoleophilaceae bacterium]|nr:antibiotic biosynthesis monooxygenase [Thermoleophilaceae bacterium]
MYGLIGQMQAVPGERARLMQLLASSSEAMPGCLSYVIAADKDDLDSIWITEIWDSAESHKASLEIPAVREAITQARPLIAGFGTRAETEPLERTP